MSQMSSSPNSLSSSEPLGPHSFTPLNDVVCAVDVVLGTSKMTVRECLALQRDSVVRLTESAGGDMRVIVNGIALAHGEVVIVEDSTAVRITDILAPPSSEIDE